MEAIKINVNVELSFSQDAKDFFATLLCSKVTNQPATKVAQPAPSLTQTLKESAAEITESYKAYKEASDKVNAPKAEVPKAEAKKAEAPQISIEDVRMALSAKVADHRDEIKSKLTELGAPSVTKLDPSKYLEMLSFLEGLE